MPESAPLGPQPLTPSGRPCLDIFGNRVTLLLPAEHTAGHFALFDTVHQPCSSPLGLHAHPFTETFQVLEGLYQFTLAPDAAPPQTFTAGPGAVVHIPPGVPHDLRNLGRIPARAHLFVSPGSAQQFFLEVGTPVSPRCPGGTHPSLEPVPSPDLPSLAPVFDRFGVVFLET